ncbi:Uroporphyrinogen-III synthase [Bacillus methanolicus PB1]|uniref:Uroporphyrinogen-III synthase n=1 Tax=Bacillus methanolicus PB1 TaxID=997296 RepID=I3DXU2_BACMT|nr:uroporphyrinogen-III synthase [Bacillus methanolicus]EIJ79063.1 Uroporphyrinogen-III synthase [Bacillus methanolicus PB1]
MSHSLPLQGKNVLIPRGKNHTKSFAKLVRDYGGIPVEIPLIAFRPVSDTKKIREIFRNLDSYDWIIFTSSVTVDTFFSFLGDGKIVSKIAVIGEKTEQTLNEKGYKADFRPSEYVAEGFVKEFLPYVMKGLRILLPKGSLARDYITSSLKERGACVEEVVIYETYLPETSRTQLVDIVQAGKLDILTFTSSSTVIHFMEIVHANNGFEKIKDCLVACIGPVTAEKASSLGLKVDVVPNIFTIEEMVKGIVKYIENNN